jgi:hypothetical protein
LQASHHLWIDRSSSALSGVLTGLSTLAVSVIGVAPEEVRMPSQATATVAVE